MNRILRACAAFSAVLLAAAAPGVSVSAPWARATAPRQTQTVVYLQLTSAAADSLTSIDSSAGMAMLHRSTISAGRSDMQDLEFLPLPAGKIVPLAPGGVHIMLMDLAHGLSAGDHVRLTLHFAHAAPLAVVAPVLPIGARGP